MSLHQFDDLVERLGYRNLFIRREVAEAYGQVFLQRRGGFSDGVCSRFRSLYDDLSAILDASHSLYQPALLEAIQNADERAWAQVHLE